MPAEKTPNVVFDSGVLVSAFLTPRGLSAELLKRCGETSALYLSEEILSETRIVLTERQHLRERYRYTEEQVERFLAIARDLSHLVVPTPGVRAVEQDPKDNAIIATALAAEADVLVARDRHLLDMRACGRIAIVTPEAFIARLRRSALLG